MTDVDLNACLGGDARAWAAFVERWSRVIFVAVRRTFDAHRSSASASPDVDDAVQDVFVRLVKDDFRLLRTYDAGRASLSTWLTIVARSMALDALRKGRRDPISLDGTSVREPGTTDHPVSEAAAGPEIPLHLLTARQRLVLRMLFQEEMSVAEAAGTLGVDEQTIRSTKHKALSRLREHLGTG